MKTKWLAIGCTHGDLIHWPFIEKVLEFKADFKPHTVIHLGDAFDFACLRNGASAASPDYTANLQYDIDGGLRFMAEWFKGARKRIYMLGNHEVRAYKKAHDPSAHVSFAAEQLIEATAGTIERKHNATVYPYHSTKGVYQQGDTAFLHGYTARLHSCRAVADRYGKAVFAHTHRFGIGVGQSLAQPVAYNVGCAIDFEQAHYAHQNPNLCEWQHGFAFGIYDDKTGVNEVWPVAEQKDGSIWVPEKLKQIG